MSSEENKEIKDPLGLVKYGRKSDGVGKVIILENRLASLTTEEMYRGDRVPYEIHNNYSVFKLVILKNGTSCYANIPPKALKDIELNTNFANDILLKSKQRVATSGQKKEGGSAFTVKFFLGDFKGLSPAEILLKDPANKDKLLSQIDFLSANLEKYPRNKGQIDAINEAIQLFDSGKLNADCVDDDGSSGTDPIEIYVEDVKIPDMRKIDKNGNTFVYSISIKCHPEMAQPYVVNITNCMAPPIKGEMSKVKLSEAKSKIDASFTMTKREWNNMMSAMVDTEKTFKMVNYTRIDKAVRAYLDDVKRSFAAIKNNV